MPQIDSTRAHVRAVEAPFVLALGALAVGVAVRVAWAARGGAVVLVAPPLVVAGVVLAGVSRTWRDLRAAAAVEIELAALEGREGEARAEFVVGTKDLIDRASSTLPSVCILVGLLGTFAGLFEALVGSRDLLSTAVDAAALREVVGAPLAGLARAFGSSAAGIVGSVVLGVTEGRFQRVADAIAVRLESVEGELRNLALAARIREALATSGGPAADIEARDQRIATALERVARAVEPLAAEGAATRTVLVESRSLLGELKAAIQQGADASAASVREAAKDTIGTWKANAEANGVAMRSSFESLAETVRTAHDAASASIASGFEETRRSIDRAQTLTAEVVSTSCTAVSRSVADGAERIARVVEATGAAHSNTEAAARDAHGVQIAGALTAHEATLLRFTSANASALDALSRVASELGASTGAMVEQARARDEASMRANNDLLAGALEAWAKRDDERYAREESQRRARWEDDDARRAEWSGAEKLVLQAAMDMLAERLSAVAEVQARVGATVERASLVLRELQEASSRVGEAASAERARAEESFLKALTDGAATIADTLARHTGELVTSTRGELSEGTAALDDRAKELAEIAHRAEASALDRLASLEAAATAIGAHSSDVARAVETLAEVVRGVPFDAAATSAGAALAPDVVPVAVSTGAATMQSDEDRAAFVACLEEARRWFDASQALQQKFLDEATQLRTGGHP